jgi:hypothetical protein
MIAQLRTAMEIPAGYQDKTGFYPGTEPVVTEVLPQPDLKPGNGT